MGGHQPKKNAYSLAAVKSAAVPRTIGRRDQLFPTLTRIHLLTLGTVSIRSISRAVDIEDNSVAGDGAQVSTGPSINDVTLIFHISGPPPPFVMHSHNLSVLLIRKIGQFLNPPSPP